MNELKITLLVFFLGIPFFFFLGILSFFYSNEFLGIWILSLREYPLSYSIFFAVVFSCATLLNFLLGNIKNYTKLICILLGIFLGSIINLCLVILGFVKIGYYFYFIVSLFLTVIIQQIEWVENILIICFASALLFVFNFYRKKLDDIKEKILLAILIFSLPFFPIIIFPLLGCFIGARFSSGDRKNLSLVKRVLLGIPKLTLVLFWFIWIMKSSHLPGLIISPNIRAILGSNYHYVFNTESEYKAAIKKLYNIKKEARNKAKIFSETGVKTIEVSECL